MLLSLKIQNLILIEKAEIAFGPGLNILTGETGAGKSAVLEAIRLISGERAESQMIREGAPFAIVEATLSDFACEDEEIALEQGQSVTIRREIHRSGKNRCFVEDHQVHLAFLKKWIGIERVDQSSSLSLCSQQQQRVMLDTFADTLSLAAELSANFAKEKALEKELQDLLQLSAQRERELEWAQKDLKMLEEINWQEGEEEKLAEEHHLLTHAQELLEKTSSISSALSEGSEPLVPLLKRFFTSLESLSRVDAKLAPIAQSLKNCALELDEVDHALRAYFDRIDADPARLVAVENRIAALETIKRRFGTDIHQEKEKRIEQIDRLSRLDSMVETLEITIGEQKKINEKLASTLSSRRREAAARLSSLVLEELKSLNLVSAQFRIALQSKPLSSFGADEIQFLFTANPGTAPLPLEECASGGELSRLLLALKTLLAEKENSSCLVFDEIDSNVGGKTAAILGGKLKKLSLNRQIICVTHFVQVAKCASDHFLISKTEKGGRAYTLVSKLAAIAREDEYNRMLGNKF